MKYGLFLTARSTRFSRVQPLEQLFQLSGGVCIHDRRRIAHFGASNDPPVAQNLFMDGVIDPSALFCETVSNPALEITDLEAVAKVDVSVSRSTERFMS